MGSAVGVVVCDVVSGVELVMRVMVLKVKVWVSISFRNTPVMLVMVTRTRGAFYNQTRVDTQIVEGSHCNSLVSGKYATLPHRLPRVLVATIVKAMSGCLLVCMSVYLSVCLSVGLSVCLFVCMSVCLYVCLSVGMSIYMSVCMYVCMSVCLYVCRYVCLHVCLPVCMCVCVSVCMCVCLSGCLYGCRSV